MNASRLLSSSSKTFLLKQVFPPLLPVMLVISYAGSVDWRFQDIVPALIGLGVVAVVAGFVAHRLARRLADRVLDCGDHLLISRGSEEDKVALSNIRNVSDAATIAAIRVKSPAVITLELVAPCKFGAEIVFIPAAKSGPAAGPGSSVAEQLTGRVNKARICK